jgi:hypothetical protein
MKIPVHKYPARPGGKWDRSTAVVVAFALVDDDTAVLASEFWTLSRWGYARTTRGGRSVFMHHAVIGRRPGLDVSHENANKLDNRRGNLRHATRSENLLNPADGPTRALRSNGFRGVSRDDRSHALARPWRGKVQIKGKSYQTARFSAPEEAAAALAELRGKLLNSARAAV